MTPSPFLPALLIGAMLAFVAPLSAGTPITVTLRDEGSAPDKVVCLRDVADIRCADAALRASIEEIDLWEFKTGAETEASITQSLVQTRLLLAGFSIEDLNVAGEFESIVRLEGNRPVAGTRPARAAVGKDCVLTDLALERHLQTHISSRLNVPAEDVRVQLSNPCLGKIVPRELLGEPGLVDLTLPSRPSPGRIMVGVRVLTRDRLIGTLQTQVDLAVRQPVLVTTASFVRGSQLDAGGLSEQTEWVTRLELRPRLAEAVGCMVTRDIPEGQILKMTDLVRRSALPGGGAEQVVKVRDAVRMTARKGSLVVVVRGAEAQQPGRVGEWIRVKNTESNRIVTARVVGPGEVEVPLF